MLFSVCVAIAHITLVGTWVVWVSLFSSLTEYIGQCHRNLTYLNYTGVYQLQLTTRQVKMAGNATFWTSGLGLCSVKMLACVYRDEYQRKIFILFWWRHAAESPVVTPADVNIERDYFVYKSLCNLKVYISLCFQSCVCVYFFFLERQ